MKNYKIDILDNNTVEVYDLDNPNENGAPFFRQDVHPIGRPWVDKAEAEDWINALLIEWETPQSVEEVPVE